MADKNLESNTGFTSKKGKSASSGTQKTRHGLHSFYDNFEDLQFIVGNDGTILDANQKVADRFSMKLSEVVGSPYLELFSEQHREELTSLLTGATPERSQPFGLPYQTKTGERIKCESRMRSGSWKKQNVVFINSQDITLQGDSDNTRSYDAEMFYKAFHSNPALMAISSFEDSRYIDVNDSFLQALGFEKEELIGHTSTELQLYVDILQSDKFFKKLQRVSKVKDFEVTIKTKTGEKRTGLFSAETINLQGEPCLLTIINDITELKEAEENLEQTESRYKEVLESMSNCVVVYEVIDEGKDFRILEFNRAAREVEKVGERELSGMLLSKAFPVAFKTEIVDILKNVWKSGEPESIVIHFEADGSAQWRDNYIYKLPSGEVVAIYDDITQKKIDEEALKESEIRYRELAELLPLMLFEAKLDGTISYANRYGFLYTRYSQKDIDKGLNFSDFFSEEDSTFTKKLIEQRLIGKGDSKPQELTVVRKDGTTFPALIYTNLIYTGIAAVGIRGVVVDITERKQAQETLEMEKIYLEELIESAPEAIVMNDTNGIIQQINSEFTRLFGYTEKEAIGKSVDDLLASDEIKEEATKATETIASGERVEFDSLRKRKDGRMVDVSVMGTPITFNNKQVGIYGIYRDITVRKKSEKVQNLIYNISRAVITTKDLEDLINVIKAELSKVLDTTNFFIALYNKEENSLSLPFFRDEKDDFKDIPAGKTITAYVINKKKPTLLYSKDMVVLEKRGEIELVGSDCKVWLGAPLPVKDEIIGVISLQSYTDELAYTKEDMDILEFIASQVGISIQWKKAETALFESLGKYRAVAETTIAGIGISDPGDNLSYVNHAFSTMLGYRPEELIGKNFSSISSKEEYSKYREQTSIVKTGKQNQYETQLKKKDGSNINVLIYGSPLFDEKKKFQEKLEVMIDITQLKRTQEALLKAKEVAEEAVKAKQQFLSTMSHEIRTPLNAVIGMAYLLQQEDPRPDQKENVDNLKFSAENLLVLINDILDYSKIESGKITFEEIDFNLRELLNGIRKSLAFKADEKNITLDSEIDESIPDIIVGDPVRLNQILTNLISNAIKFTEKGGVTLNTQFISEDKKETRIGFTIEDTGIGIRKEVLKTIFESFTQASVDTTRKYGGTGLGLAICKQLLAIRKSKLDVTSTVGKGSKFSFSMTFPKSDLKELKEIEDFGETKFEQLKDKKVLLVEDNKMNQIVASKFLEKWGMDVTIASDGKEAVEYFKKNRYDLILMDIQMPVMNGYEAAASIREMNQTGREIPIIAMTASVLTEVHDRIQAAAMEDFILKPFNPNELYSKIVKYVR